MDLLDVALAFAAAPWWLGWTLLGGGLLSFGMWIGVNL